MENESQSKTLEQRFEAIERVSRELEEKGMPFGQVYLAKLKEFWTALAALFGEDKALRDQYKEKFPGIARFPNLKSFEKFYIRAVRSKIEKLLDSSSETLKKQFIHMAQTLNGEGINFLIPYVEEALTDGSYVCRTGGVHVDAKFFLPDCNDETKAVQSRHKHFPGIDIEEFKLENLCLSALAKLGYKVSEPESFADDPLVLATKMYAGDLKFLQSLDGKKIENIELRKKYAMKIIDELVPIIIHLTASYEGKISVKNDSEKDLEELFKHEEYFDKNRKRFGFTTEGLYDIFISELAMTTGTDVKGDKILEELTKEFNRLVYAKLDSFKKFMLHGDMYVGNVLEDTNADLAITDFTPFKGPITFDLFSIIEHLQSNNQARKEILQYAAKKIFEYSPRLGISLEAKTEEKYFEQLMHEYQWTSIHRNLNFAGIILKYLRDPENKRELPPPSIFYSKAIKILDELGKSKPEYHTLASSLDRYVRKRFIKDGKPLLEEREIGEIDFSFLADKEFSLSGSTKEAFYNLISEADEQKVSAETDSGGKDLSGCITEPQKIELERIKEVVDKLRANRTPEDDKKSEETLKSVMSIKRHDAPQEAVYAELFRETIIYGNIQDKGKAYVCTLPTDVKLSDKIMSQIYRNWGAEIPTKTTFTINKLQNEIEYSLRGKELHVINHKENRRYKINLAEENSELKQYESPITPYTDRRTVWDALKLLETATGKKITIETLEDRVLFKKKGLFGSKVVDEILFDTASTALQVAKYLNSQYASNKKITLFSNQDGEKTESDIKLYRNYDFGEAGSLEIADGCVSAFFDFDRSGFGSIGNDRNTWLAVVDKNGKCIPLRHNSNLTIQNGKAEMKKEMEGEPEPASESYKLGENPFCLDHLYENKIMIYKQVNGISQLTTLEAEKTQHWNEARDNLRLGTTLAGAMVAGGYLATQNPWYSAIGIGGAALLHGCISAVPAVTNWIRGKK